MGQLTQQAKEDITIVGSKPVKKIPPKYNSVNRKPYEFLCKAVGTLEPGEALEIHLPKGKKHRLTSIQKALNDAFPNTPHKLTQRNEKGSDVIRAFIFLSKS